MNLLKRITKCYQKKNNILIQKRVLQKYKTIIAQKKDYASGKLTEGIVKDVLTSQHVHPWVSPKKP